MTTLLKSAANRSAATLLARKSTEIKEGKYLYGIVAASENDTRPETFGNIGIGGRSDEVSILWSGAVGAVVSRSPIITYSIAKEHLTAHERVLETVMVHYTLLPVRYSLVAESDEKLLRLLERERETFTSLLSHLHGKKELGLKAVFPESIFQDILTTNATLKAKKDALEKQRSKTTHDLIEIGQAVEAALEVEKKKIADDVLHELSSLAVEHRSNKPASERMILNMAFLVEHANEKTFDEKVAAISEKYPKVKFKYAGNLPPYNFVNLKLTMEN